MYINKMTNMKLLKKKEFLLGEERKVKKTQIQLKKEWANKRERDREKEGERQTEREKE